MGPYSQWIPLGVYHNEAIPDQELCPPILICFPLGLTTRGL